MSFWSLEYVLSDFAKMTAMGWILGQKTLSHWKCALLVKQLMWSTILCDKWSKRDSSSWRCVLKLLRTTFSIFASLSEKWCLNIGAFFGCPKLGKIILVWAEFWRYLKTNVRIWIYVLKTAWRSKLGAPSVFCEEFESRKLLSFWVGLLPWFAG